MNLIQVFYIHKRILKILGNFIVFPVQFDIAEHAIQGSRYSWYSRFGNIKMNKLMPVSSYAKFRYYSWAKWKYAINVHCTLCIWNWKGQFIASWTYTSLYICGILCSNWRSVHYTIWFILSSFRYLGSFRCSTSFSRWKHVFSTIYIEYKCWLRSILLHIDDLYIAWKWQFFRGFYLICRR